MFCIPQVLYKENLGRATPTPITPEMERVKRNQEQISSVLSGRSKVAKTELKLFFFKFAWFLFNPLIFPLKCRKS